MFRRPKKKALRPRVVTFGESGEEEEQDEEMEVDVPLETTSTTIKSENSKPKQPTLLSFHDDEEEEDVEFKVKKSSVSRKLIKQRGKEKSKPSSMQQFPVKKEIEQKPSAKVVEANNSIKTEEIININSSSADSRPSSKSNTGMDRILTGREAEAVDMESEDSEDEEEQSSSVRFRRPARSDVTEAVRLTLERAQIPDANLIHEARKRRQMAREMHGPGAGGSMPAVISLKDPSSQPRPRHRIEGSRFIREDDENDKSDEEEDDRRIDFSNATNAEKIDRNRRLEVFNAAADEDRDCLSDDSDLEIDEWERQQINKAITKSQIQQAAVAEQQAQHNSSEFTPTTTTVITLLDHQPSSAAAAAPTKSNNSITSASAISTALSIDDIINGKNKVNTESIFKKLTERLENLKFTHDRNIGELNRLSCELELILTESNESELMKPKLSTRFLLYQRLKSYIYDLIDCYRCKVPLISAIEKKIIDLMKQRATRLIERRRKDTSDQLEEINTTLRSSALTAPTATAGAGNNMLGDEERIKRAAEREGRRTRRRRTRELRNIQNHKDGLSSDDEETDYELTTYRNQLNQLFNESTTEIFQDVSPEFCNIDKVLEFFLQWRIEDYDSYKESYAFLCIPKCLSPLIRLQILTWDPLIHDLDFKQFPWLNSLLKYSLDNSQESIKDVCKNLDSKLIPAIAEKVLVPWIELIIRTKYDPISVNQTRRLVNIIKKLINEWFVTPNCKSLRNLLATIIIKFKDALENDIYIPIFPMQALVNKCSPASVFSSRQFWSGVKLLDNMSSWCGILSDEILQILALDALLTRYLLLGIRMATDLNDSAERANGIINVIPSVWISSNNNPSNSSKDKEQQGQGTIANEPPNGIQQFIHCLITMVQNADCLIAINKIGVQEIAKILKNLGAINEAEMVLSKYS